MGLMKCIEKYIPNIFGRKGLNTSAGLPPKRSYDRMFAQKDVDQGWAWLVMLCSFFGCFITAGMCYSCGVYYKEYVIQFPSQKIAVSILTSLPSALFVLLGPVSMFTSRKLGYHWTVVFGCTMGTLGFIAAYFAHGVYQLVLTQGIMVGIGGGMLYSPVVCVLKLCFVKRYVLANAFGLTGVALGCLSFPFIYQVFIQSYGLRISLLCNACIYVHIYIIAAILAYPSSDKSETCRKMSINLIRRCSRQSLVSMMTAPPVMVVDMIETIKEEENDNSVKFSSSSANDSSCDDIEIKPREDIFANFNEYDRDDPMSDGRQLLGVKGHTSKGRLNNSGSFTKNINDKIQPGSTNSLQRISVLNSQGRRSYSLSIKPGLLDDENIPIKSNCVSDIIGSPNTSSGDTATSDMLPQLNATSNNIKVNSLKAWLFVLYSPLEQASCIIILLLIIRYTKQKGLTDYESASMISWVGTGELIGSISVVLWGLYYSKIIEEKQRFEFEMGRSAEYSLDNGSSLTGLYFWVALLCQGIVSVLLALNLSTLYAYYSVLMVLFGTFFGVRITLLNAIVIDLFGSINFTRMYSLYFFFAGVGCIISLPLATWLETSLGNPNAIFYITSSTFAGCILIMAYVMFHIYKNKWIQEKQWKQLMSPQIIHSPSYTTASTHDVI